MNSEPDVPTRRVAPGERDPPPRERIIGEILLPQDDVLGHQVPLAPSNCAHQCGPSRHDNQTVAYHEFHEPESL